MTPEAPLTPRERVKAVQRAAVTSLPYAAITPQGEVQIGAVEPGSDGDAHWVDVWLIGADQTAPPSFRIVNPPLAAGEPLRLDPMRAIAEAIALHGGASKR